MCLPNFVSKILPKYQLSITGLHDTFQMTERFMVHAVAQLAEASS
jgi:hypothetical protein